ncbi:MAG TPA: flagellar export chaperone FliS [Solirubrobacteraceae bacterium]|nr:flagellar export chaperone FliS [Solirubrobacteraceae bacterium]
MSTYTASQTAAYRQQSILTATPGQLVVMLYDGCLRFLHQAAYAMREGKTGEADARLSRAEAIIDELLATLDLEKGGVVASRLQGIYVFCSRHLIEARMGRDPEMIEKVGELLGELRDAWAQVAAA